MKRKVNEGRGISTAILRFEECTAFRRTTAVVEGADYLMDMGSRSWCKKRGSDATLNNAVYDVEDSSPDESYISFLDDLQEFSLAKSMEKDENDPMYTMFLENLKECGNSYMLDVSVKHGVSFPIKYEVDSHFPSELKRKTPRSYRKSSSGQRKNLFRKPDQEIDHSSDQDHKRGSGADMVDETYGVFMSGLRVEGESVFYEFGDCQRVYYEASDLQWSTDIEIEKSERAHKTRKPTSKLPSSTPRQPSPTLRASTPSSTAPTPTDHHNVFSISDKRLQNNGKSSCQSYSWFWKGIKVILGKPYEQKDYEDLWERATARKPVLHCRSTRRGDYDVPGQTGKSYLDMFPDLHHEIKNVKSDPRKVLKFLRVFFFYLENIPHGVPNPWSDDLFKKMMSGSS